MRLFPKRPLICIAMLAWLICTSSFAAGITVQSGAKVALGGANLQMGCSDILVAGHLSLGNAVADQIANVVISGGSLNAQTATLNSTGDWTNNGTFDAGTSQVNFIDGCGSTQSVISGDTQFSAFSAVSASSKTLRIAAGSSQSFQRNLTLQGAAGSPILIRSSVTGSQAFFNLLPGASQNIFSVDVQDNNADGGITIAAGPASDFNSTDSGNILNWFVATLAAMPVPLLSTPALGILILMIMIIGALRSKALRRGM